MPIDQLRQSVHNLSINPVVIFGPVVFKAGSLLCTFASNSQVFKLGRAVAGSALVRVGEGPSSCSDIAFPLFKQALMGGLAEILSVNQTGVCSNDWRGFDWRLQLASMFRHQHPLGAFCALLSSLSAFTILWQIKIQPYLSKESFSASTSWVLYSSVLQSRVFLWHWRGEGQNMDGKMSALLLCSPFWGCSFLRSAISSIAMETMQRYR